MHGSSAVRSAIHDWSNSCDRRHIRRPYLISRVEMFVAFGQHVLLGAVRLAVQFELQYSVIDGPVNCSFANFVFLR